MWFLLFDKWEGRLKVISPPGQPHPPPGETQIELQVDEAANATKVVTTPDGPMLLFEALRQRGGAFSLKAGNLSHDSTWVGIDEKAQ